MNTARWKTIQILLRIALGIGGSQWSRECCYAFMTIGDHVHAKKR